MKEKLVGRRSPRADLADRLGELLGHFPADLVIRIRPADGVEVGAQFGEDTFVSIAFKIGLNQSRRVEIGRLARLAEPFRRPEPKLFVAPHIGPESQVLIVGKLGLITISRSSNVVIAASPRFVPQT